MSHLTTTSLEQRVELRDIAEAVTGLAELMQDHQYQGEQVTGQKHEQQALAWAMAFRCMGERAATLANDLVDESIDTAGAEPEGGRDAD